MMKNSPKKKRPDFFTAAEVGVLIEDLRSQFRVFGEGQDIIKNHIDGLETRFDTLERRFDTLEIKVTGIDMKTEAVRTNQVRTLERITGLEISVARILEDTTGIKKIVADHENRITRLETSKL
jgi:hypothetical protein